MFRYKKFISEKRENLILESLDSSTFILSPDLHNLLSSIFDSNKSYSKIAKVFLDLDLTTNDNLKMSYFDIGVDNQSITYLNPIKIDKIRIENNWTIDNVFNNVDSLSSIRIGKFTNKAIELYNKKFSENLNFTASEKEDFVNAYKAQWDFLNNKSDNLKLVGGSLINYWYSGYKYHKETGTLGNSCMKWSECSDYLDIYTESKNVRLLILVTPELRISGRAIIWTLTDDSLFMDRIYTNDDSDVNLFIKWCEDNSCGYKFEQNSKVGHICLPKNDFKPMPVKLEVKVYPVSYSSRHEEKFPYMDTMKYYYWREGMLRNWKDDEKGPFIILEDTKGLYECDDCVSDGFVTCSVCFGREKDCNNCSGRGIEDCPTCEGYCRI